MVGRIIVLAVQSNWMAMEGWVSERRGDGWSSTRTRSKRDDAKASSASFPPYIDVSCQQPKEVRNGNIDLRRNSSEKESPSEVMREVCAGEGHVLR